MVCSADSLAPVGGVVFIRGLEVTKKHTESGPRDEAISIKLFVLNDISGFNTYFSTLFWRGDDQHNH